MPEIAIITGGTKGLGRALVEKWLEEGWNVATCARNATLFGELSVRFDESRLLTAEIDVANEKAVTSFVDEVASRWGTPQVLINSAAILGPQTPLVDYLSTEWQQVLDVNLSGMFYMTKAVLSHMLPAREGVILNITSSSGIAAKANRGAYAVSKFGVEGFTQILRAEVQDSRIRVHAVNPGYMKTEMREAALGGEASDGMDPEVIARIIFDIAVVYEPQLVRLKASDYL